MRVLDHVFHKNEAYRGDELDPEKYAATPQAISCMGLILCVEADILIEEPTPAS